jgi:hypothetical protein
MAASGQLLPAAFEAASVRYRRYGAVGSRRPECVLLPLSSHAQQALALGA